MRGLQSKPSIAMSVTGENKYQNLGRKKRNFMGLWVPELDK